MKILWILLPLSLSLNAMAKCTFSADSKDVVLKWTAFKTPKKLGVSGKFTSLGLKKTKSATSLKDLLSNTEFEIDALKIDSGDKLRDEKLSKFFFGNMSATKIKGKVKEMSKGVVNVEVTMNGVSHVIPMVYTKDKAKFSARGYLDILDFSMSKSLKAINEACSALHEGKTWSDVEVNLSFSYKQKCS